MAQTIFTTRPGLRSSSSIGTLSVRSRLRQHYGDDEVHFLQDAYRGPVWEEVIIHLPQHVQLVCLSATVSNARDLGDCLSGWTN